MPERIFQTSHGRVYLQLGGAGPTNVLEYQGMARMGGFARNEGEPARVQLPSTQAYDRFDDVDEVTGESSRPTTSMIARFGLTNPILSANRPFHLQAHYGKCGDPRDANGGWEKILAYEGAKFTNRSGDEQTALDESNRATILLTGDVSARKMWEIDQMALGAVAGEEVTREVVDIVLQDYISSGECGYTSDGENRIFAVTKSSGAGSPGMPAELLVSVDGGLTWDQYTISTLGAAEEPVAFAVVGQYIVVLSTDSASLHIATIADPSTWTEISTGFVAGGAPIGISSQGSTRTWIVGENGYIYFMANPADGVSVQSAGTVTSEDLSEVHATDSMHVLAGGANGALIVTYNGGKTWTAAATSPTVAAITALWMHTAYCWLVGTATGRLYITINGGTTWLEKVFPMTAMGAVNAFSFADHADSPFGFLAATNGSKGFIFRTIDGGNTWYQLPDTEGTTPANDRFNRISAGPSGNFVVAGGLGDDALDGVIVIGS